MRRGLSSLLIVGIAASLLAGCAGKGKPPSAKKPAAQEKTALKAEFRKAQITWDDANGQRILEARFKEAVASADSDSARVELRGVQAGLFQNGKPASSLSADRVTADSRNKEVTATGGVTITSRDGSSAQSSQVIWKSRENKLFGSGSVKLTKGSITITADRFEADTALKHARFYQGKAEVR